jgi:hypothetical protein
MTILLARKLKISEMHELTKTPINTLKNWRKKYYEKHGYPERYKNNEI